MRWLGNTPIILQMRTRGEQKRLDLDSATLFVEEIKGQLSVSVMHYCLAGTDGLYNPLLLGVVNDIEDMAESAINFAPSVVESSA